MTLSHFQCKALADASEADGLCRFPTGGVWRSLSHTGVAFSDETVNDLRGMGYLAFSPDGRRLVVTDIGRAVHEKTHGGKIGGR